MGSARTPSRPIIRRDHDHPGDLVGGLREIALQAGSRGRGEIEIARIKAADANAVSIRSRSMGRRSLRG